MAKEAVVSNRLLSNKRFREDLKQFLRLPSEALRAIAELARNPDGFAPTQKASLLSERTKLSPDVARDALALAEYLYRQVTEHNIPVADAVATLTNLAVEFDIVVSDSQRTALEEILVYKREYETGLYARFQAIEVGPHFGKMQGSWTIRVQRTRENEVVKVPILALNVSWHDSEGDHHEAFLQMSEKDWGTFKETVERLSREREALQKFLDA